MSLNSRAASSHTCWRYTLLGDCPLAASLTSEQLEPRGHIASTLSKKTHLAPLSACATRVILSQVYAPCPARLEHGQGQAVAQREAYEAAAMGPRGACLKEEQGRVWVTYRSGSSLGIYAKRRPAALLERP